MSSRPFSRHAAGILLLCLSASFSAHAVLIADSIADFSGVQGQDGWSYGIFNQGNNPALGYTTGGFELLDDFIGTAWRASDSLVGAQNNDFLNLSAAGGHPTGLGPGGQDAIIWAVRRFTASEAGNLLLDFELRKSNTGNPNGGGITGRIFVDGNEQYTELVANDDGAPGRNQLLVNVGIGSVIDFVIDPTGVSPGSDGDFSARADGSVFSARIFNDVPEPATLAVFGLGLLAAGRARRRA